MGGAAPVLTTISFVASAITNTASITIPAGAQAGDVGVLCDHAVSNNGSVPPTLTVPATWTQVAESSATGTGGGTSVRGITSWKILTGGDPNTSITGMPGTEFTGKVLFVFRGNVPITVVTPSTWNAESIRDAAINQTVLSSGGAAPLVNVGWNGGINSSGAFTSVSPSFDATVADAASRCLAGYLIQNGSPVDQSLSRSSARHTMHSGWLSIN